MQPNPLRPRSDAESYFFCSQEHSWWSFETFHPLRPALFESVDKRNYYLTNVRPLDAGVVRLEHKNREGERLDIIFDRRGAAKGGWMDGVASMMQTVRR